MRHTFYSLIVTAEVTLIYFLYSWWGDIRVAATTHLHTVPYRGNSESNLSYTLACHLWLLIMDVLFSQVEPLDLAGRGKSLFKKGSQCDIWPFPLQMSLAKGQCLNVKATVLRVLFVSGWSRHEKCLYKRTLELDIECKKLLMKKVKLEVEKLDSSQKLSEKCENVYILNIMSIHLNGPKSSEHDDHFWN